MKKLFSILLIVLMLTTLLASCGTPVNTNTDTGTNTESNTNIEDDNSKPKSLYELAVEAGFEGTLEEWGEAVANVDETPEPENEPKSLYELAVEAGFEGTLEEWGEAVANVKDTSEDKNECTCQNNITKGEAILIAQNHLFAIQPPECSLSLTYSAFYLREDEETWTILVAKYDVNPNDEEDSVVMGGGYTYVIEKSTGRILEITAGE